MTSTSEAFQLAKAKVAVLGYGGDAREQALALCRAGNIVAVALPPGRASSPRADADCLAAVPAADALDGAAVIVVNMHHDEQPATFWRDCLAHVAPAALVVFVCAIDVQTGAFDPPGADVVLVVDGGAACRIAVHRDGTGRALPRAFAYARAAFGDAIAIDGTTVAAESDRELAAVGERVSGVFAVMGSDERGRDDDRDDDAERSARAMRSRA
jgi:ketol-acid reductoisomerase